MKIIPCNIIQETNGNNFNINTQKGIFLSYLQPQNGELSANITKNTKELQKMMSQLLKMLSPLAKHLQNNKANGKESFADIAQEVDNVTKKQKGTFDIDILNGIDPGIQEQMKNLLFPGLQGGSLNLSENGFISDESSNVPEVSSDLQNASKAFSSGFFKQSTGLLKNGSEIKNLKLRNLEDTTNKDNMIRLNSDQNVDTSGDKTITDTSSKENEFEFINFEEKDGKFLQNTKLNYKTTAKNFIHSTNAINSANDSEIKSALSHLSNGQSQNVELENDISQKIQYKTEVNTGNARAGRETLAASRLNEIKNSNSLDLGTLKSTKLQNTPFLEKAKESQNQNPKIKNLAKEPQNQNFEIKNLDTPKLNIVDHLKTELEGDKSTQNQIVEGTESFETFSRKFVKNSEVKNFQGLENFKNAPGEKITVQSNDTLQNSDPNSIVNEVPIKNFEQHPLKSEEFHKIQNKTQPFNDIKEVYNELKGDIEISKGDKLFSKGINGSVIKNIEQVDIKDVDQIEIRNIGQAELTRNNTNNLNGTGFQNISIKGINDMNFQKDSIVAPNIVKSGDVTQKGDIKETDDIIKDTIDSQNKGNSGVKTSGVKTSGVKTIIKNFSKDIEFTQYIPVNAKKDSTSLYKSSDIKESEVKSKNLQQITIDDTKMTKSEDFLFVNSPFSGEELNIKKNSDHNSFNNKYEISNENDSDEEVTKFIFSDVNNNQSTLSTNKTLQEHIQNILKTTKLPNELSKMENQIIETGDQAGAFNNLGSEFNYFVNQPENNQLNGNQSTQFVNYIPNHVHEKFDIKEDTQQACIELDHEKSKITIYVKLKGDQLDAKFKVPEAQTLNALQSQIHELKNILKDNQIYVDDIDMYISDSHVSQDFNQQEKEKNLPFQFYNEPGNFPGHKENKENGRAMPKAALINTKNKSNGINLYV